MLVLQVVQLLKAGKGKEVSYNALATHIIAEDGDNPEVGESREVFDLPVVKVRQVKVTSRCHLAVEIILSSSNIIHGYCLLLLFFVKWLFFPIHVLY